MESYWGGAVAATGGALVLGALPRIFKYYRSRDALIMGAGALLLANSRPYEGFLFCVPVGIAMIAWLCSSRSPALKVTGKRELLPLVGMLALTAVSSATTIGGSRETASLTAALYNTQYLTYRVLIWECCILPCSMRTGSLNYIYNRVALVALAVWPRPC